MVPDVKGGRARRRGLRRRRFIQAAAGSALVGLGGRSVAQGVREIRLDGDANGWVGQAPSAIDGETNPTLALEVGREYELTWTNVDGNTHDFAIEDENGDVVGPTNSVSEDGESQTVAFTAVEEMTGYYCTTHPGSMRGAIEFVAADDSEAVSVGDSDVRLVSSRDLTDENHEYFHAYRKRRAIEALLADPEVNEIVDDMISSYEAYDPYTNRLDAVSVQGSPDIEIEGGIDEGAFEVTVGERRVAYGLVDRESDELVALTITEPRDVSWTVSEGEEFDEAQLRRVIDDPRVQESVDIEGDDWYPLFTVAASITSARGIEHGGVNPVVLFVAADDALTAVVVYLDVREDEAGEVIDVAQVNRFVEDPPHELAATIVPADDTVLEAVPEVPFERRPWDTANDGIHRIEVPNEAFDRSGWRIEWEPPERHGVEIAASYRGTPAFARLDSPVTYTAYGLPERGDESILEWFFPDDEPVFDGELLLWDVHSTEFGGPGPLGVIEYPQTTRRPAGFRFRSHYQTGAQDAESQDHQSGYRFGQSSHEISYDFWADGTVVPVWRRQGPGFATEYATARNGDEDTNSDSGIGADVDGVTESGVSHHSVSAVTMDVTPGTTDGVEIERYDGTAWTTPETEFYQVGEPGMVVRFTNPEGTETIDLPLDYGTEVAVVRRSAGEIPERQRIESSAVESAFYHPAQYIGNEPIQGERVIVWLLLEAATRERPHPTGSTSFVTRASIELSDY
ncbi:cupredoxin domain-containing protein [Natronococcus wangiae]|uniref:cupredoxin domain-containing protein n=1 Tax=Natronococcus wangiae TaxID=3068275 RepID=UPI00273CF786|nr:hypothetical protein [Natronococcus sp. AD5]